MTLWRASSCGKSLARSAAVSGFQTVILEYLWPKAAPDDKFLQYLYSRTEKNVLAYSVHHVLSDTRFFNLDKIYAQSGAASLDALDLQVFMLARPQGPGVTNFVEYSYGGNVRHAPRSAGWELAADFFGKQSSSTEYPPDSLPTFEIDPRTIGFNEKVALVFRGEFDALPLCLALPFGHYYRTEEIFYSSTERRAGQLGHIILFDFPALRVSQLDTFLDDLLRNPALVAHYNSSLLVEHNLAVTQGVRLGQVNPLRANPYDFVGGHYIHLPKRQLQDGTWHTLSLKEQMNLLKTAWNHTA